MVAILMSGWLFFFWLANWENFLLFLTSIGGLSTKWCPTLVIPWTVACQGILPTQKSNPGHLHCRQILHQLSYEGSPLSELLLWKSVLWAYYFFYINSRKFLVVIDIFSFGSLFLDGTFIFLGFLWGGVAFNIFNW